MNAVAGKENKGREGAEKGEKQKSSIFFKENVELIFSFFSLYFRRMLSWPAVGTGARLDSKMHCVQVNTGCMICP